jgi:hypothetical protein
MKPASQKGLIWTSVGILVLAGGAAVWFFFQRNRKPDVEMDGGTVLVYEVDRDQHKGDYDSQGLITALQRRMDRAGLSHVTVRSAGPDQVEFVIPRAADHSANVERLKKLVGRTASLEFRIVASTEFDAPAIDAAREEFEFSFGRAPFKQDLDALAFLGVPPPPVECRGENRFVARNEDQEKMGNFTYSWVELSPEYCREHGLANPRHPQTKRLLDPDKDEDRGEIDRLIGGSSTQPPKEQPHRWVLMAAAARKRAAPFLLFDNLMFTRPVTNPRTLEREPEKCYEYFILTRDPEDPSKRITEAHLSGAKPSADFRAIDFTFRPDVGDLVEEFTTKNRKQLMAILLDGRVYTAAIIQSPIRDQGRIVGTFSRRDVEDLAAVLDSGSLPAPLKPEPAKETVIEPK